MTNLLPKQAHRSVIFEYWMRVGTVWAVMLTFGFVAIGLLLLPTYRLLQSQHEVTVSEQSVIRAAPVTDIESAERLVRETNYIAGELQQKTVLVNLSEVIAAVNTAVIDGVRVRSYDVTRNGTAVQSLRIQGVAASREVLANFRTSLESQALFASAEVPIGDLVRDTNLPFVITIEIASSFNK